MNVHLKAPITGSRALDRVIAALTQHAPAGVTFTDEVSADLVVFHVVGRRDQVIRQVHALHPSQRYAVIQYCVRSTQRPNTTDWASFWESSALVWSYYDLNALCAEDHVDSRFPFYHAPLGVDASVFTDHGALRPFIIASSGRAWTNESVRECVLAAQEVDRWSFHLGQPLSRAPRRAVVCETGISDAQLAYRYNQCAYVSGLRRGEGFELPAAEGLLCGARPVLFDRPHYRQWFGEWADYIPEASRPDVIKNLVALFQRPYRAVTAEERAGAAARFDWAPIIAGFWKRAL